MNFIKVSEAFPTQKNFTLVESIDKDTARVKIDDQEFTFKYVWEDRFNPEYVSVNGNRIRLCNTFIESWGKTVNVYVFEVS